MDATTNNQLIDETTPDADLYLLLSQGKLKIGVIDRHHPPILMKELKIGKGTVFHRHDIVILLDQSNFTGFYWKCTEAITDATNRTTPTINQRAIPGVRPDNTILQLQADYNRDFIHLPQQTTIDSSRHSL